MLSTFNQNLVRSALDLSRTKKIIIAISLDIILCVFATWISLCLRLGEIIILNWQFAFPVLMSVVIAIPVFFVWGLYKVIFRFVSGDTLEVLTKAIIIYTLIFAIIFVVISFQSIPRSIGLMQPMILFLLVIFSRWFVKMWLRKYINLKLVKKDKKEVIIYGTGISGQQLASNLIRSNEYKLLFFVDDIKNLWGGTINGYQVKSPLFLKSLKNTENVKQLWIALPKISAFSRKSLITDLRGLPLHVRTLPTFSDLTDGQVHLKDLRELDFNDLLDRDDVKPNIRLLKKCVSGRVVLVTGAGGSIGSEICRQVLKHKPTIILLAENSEIALYNIHAELKSITRDNPKYNDTTLIPLLANVQDEKKLNHIFQTWKPFTVYHTAAYKHVTIVENNIAAGISNNVIGTLRCANVAIKHKASHFVLISTDKAVRPTNIMGASKRLAEIGLQLLNDDLSTTQTKFCIVRFGNVIGSSGSVAPLFKQQIEAGGPVTLTHKDVTRYFMTITEAAQLVIQAGAMSIGGEVFLLDMGKPIKILDLAFKMIEAKGLQVKDKKTPWGDIEIQVNGLQPGEKLYEELLISDKPRATNHPRILQAHENFFVKKDFQILIKKLQLYLDQNNTLEIVDLLKKNMPEYMPLSENVDLFAKFKK